MQPPVSSCSTQSNWAHARVLVLSPTPTHPQDFGNRKRIHAVCTKLKEMGAHIDFAFYPSEADWRETIPRAQEREMAATWDDFFLLAPSVPLHAPPERDHHALDEWWDPAIGHFLTWIFAHRAYDAFIVNYTWLSRALEFAPRGVVRILDTHDRFSGRKELLASMGIAPEFFYLSSPQEEGVAFSRADVVWAIKDEEASFFRTITSKPVLTVAHVDSVVPLEPPARDPHGYLRVGVFGAANNINAVNIRNFIREAREDWKRRFAPVKLIIAGSVCDALGTVTEPFLEMMGRLEDISEFYRSVDIVAVPMEFSTGLKIKTGEALSIGAAVISTRHAFEGYRATHKFQQLPNLKEMVATIAELSFSQQRVQALREAARRSYLETKEQIDVSLEATLGAGRATNGIILHAVEAELFHEDSLYGLCSETMSRFLGYIGSVSTYVLKGKLLPTRALRSFLNRHGVLYINNTVDISALSETEIKQQVMCLSAHEVMEKTGVRLVVIDAALTSEQAIRFGRVPTVIRVTPIADLHGREIALETAGRIQSACVVSLSDSASLRRVVDVSKSTFCLWPSIHGPSSWRSGAFSSKETPFDVAILHSRRCEFGLVLAQLLNEARRKVVLIGETEGDAGDSTLAASLRHKTSRRLFAALLLKGKVAPPRIVVDCAPAEQGFDLLREALGRMRVSFLTPRPWFGGTVSNENCYVPRPHAPRSLLTTFAGVTRLLEGAQDQVLEARREVVFRDLTGDAGWATLWRMGRTAATGGDVQTELQGPLF